MAAPIVSAPCHDAAMDGAPADARRDFPLFDSLRGLAALAILVVHVDILTSGFSTWYGRFTAHLDIGVAFFFVLSAFLLYRPFVAARLSERERPGMARYARRRFVRIAPAYWAALTVGAIVPGLAGAFSDNWWVYYGLLQNFPVFTPEGACATDPLRCGIPTAWSLSIEVLFYAMLPLLVLAMARLGGGRGRRDLTIEMGLLAVLSAISVYIQARVPQEDLETWLFFSPIGRAWWFALGLALASMSVRMELRPSEPRIIRWIRRRGDLFLIAGVALFVISSLTFLTPSPSLAFQVVPAAEYVAQYLLFGLIAALLLVPAAFGDDGGGFYRRALAHPILTWLGAISYGVFLWQFPVLIGLIDLGLNDLWPARSFVIVLAATFVGTVACAALSYYLLERPLLRRYRSPRRARSSGGIGDLASRPVPAPKPDS